MKELVKRILEAGLVSKHTALLMEKWKALDADAAQIVGKSDIRKVSDEALVQFAEELSVLIEKERTSFHETKLSITMGDPMLVAWVQFPRSHIVVFRDEMGSFIFPPDEALHLRMGNRFQSEEDTWEIVESHPLHVGDRRYAHLVEANKLDLG